MANITTRNQALPWAPNWHLHMPTCLCPILNKTMCIPTHLQPVLWKRFIDDIFLIWTHGMESLKEFIVHLNTVHPTLKFTSVISPTEIAFLDLIIYTTEDKLCTRLYTKDTERHMYLNFHSEHPLNLKRSIPYSQFLRLKRIHSESHFLIQSQINLYWYFIWRDIPMNSS